jgi:FMN phosphatase YigB (HAD superfamily)/DNA-binding XRE family transcriptional regulator
MNSGETYDSIALAKAISAARRGAGLTQQELCAKANLSYSTLAKIERGAIKTPSVFTVAAIAAATNTTVEDLAGCGDGTITAKKTNNYKTSNSGIKFIYFDVNGVIVRFYQRAFTDIAVSTGASADAVEATFWHYNDAICRGEMSLSEFDEILARRLGVGAISWGEYYLNNVELISETHNLIEWASKYYPVGLLTNTMPGLVGEMIKRNILPNIGYSSVIDSSVVGAIKPELDIYEKAQAQAGYAGSEILFIDDSQANLMAAEKLGWRVLWFDDYRPNESEARIREMLAFS